MLSPVRKLDLTIHGLAQSIETTIIKDLAVTVDKLADASVATAKLQDAAVTNDKLAASAVKDLNVASDAHIASSKIASTDSAQDTSKSLVDDLQARTVRAADEVVSGNWTFLNPLVVADGVSNDHAVTLAQLNEVAAAMDSRLLAPVADLTALAAILAHDPSMPVDHGYNAMTMVLVEGTGTLYRFEAGSTAVSDGQNVVRPGDIASDATAGRWIKMFVRLENAVTLDGAQTITGAKTMNNSGNVFYGDGANLTNLQDVNVVVDPSTGSAYSDLRGSLTEIYSQLGGGNTEVNNLEEATGMNTDGTFSAYTGTNYVDAAVSMKDADILLDAALKAESDRAIGVEGDLQTELDNLETATGMAADGTFSAYTGTNYVDAAVSMKDADVLLDAAIKSEYNRATGVEGDLQTELNNLETATGMAADGTFSAYTGTNFIDAAVSMKDADVLLDAALQAESDRAIGVEGDLQAELDATQTGAGLEVDGTYVTDTTTNYINDTASATSLKAADKLLDTALKSVADRVLTLEGKTIWSNFIDSAAGGETSLAAPAGAPPIPDSELTEFFIDGRKARRTSGDPVVERVFTVAVDGSEVTFAALAEGQDAELRYWA